MDVGIKDVDLMGWRMSLLVSKKVFCDNIYYFIKDEPHRMLVVKLKKTFLRDWDYYDITLSHNYVLKVKVYIFRPQVNAFSYRYFF